MESDGWHFYNFWLEQSVFCNLNFSKPYIIPLVYGANYDVNFEEAS